MKGLRALGGISAVNGLVAALALVTSPLQARALGPGGRGDLAAIVVSFGLVPIIVDFGLTVFAARATARGVSARRLHGTLVPIALGVGIVVALTSPLLADLIANGRDDVHDVVLLAFLLMPLFLATTIPLGVIWGREDWRVWTAIRLIPPVLLLVIYVALYVLEAFTVRTAGMVVVGVTVVSIVPLIPVVLRSGWARFEPPLAREALSYGSKVWVSTVTTVSTARLDQLLMVRLVANTELGWYVVATNIATLQGVFVSAVTTVMFPRVSRGDLALVGRALRLSMLGAILMSAALAVLVVPVVPALFGDDFGPVVQMTHILLIAAVPQAGMLVLAQGLSGAGHPGVAGKGHLLSLAVTVPGLLLAVGSTGGDGAAAISLVGYTISLVYLVAVTRDRLGVPIRDLIRPRRSDFQLRRRASDAA
jgi:O-antigen/teichoic acid export membrane protein